MFINIFLDDERSPDDVTWLQLPDVEWIVLRTASEFKLFVEELGMNNIGYISFDHDIASFTEENKEITGYDLLRWLGHEAQGIDLLPKCMFHTKNPIGKKNMEAYYINYLNFINGKNRI